MMLRHSWPGAARGLHQKTAVAGMVAALVLLVGMAPGSA